jgi:hypothetical protein
MYAERLKEVQMTAAGEESRWNSHHSQLLLLSAHKAAELRDELIPSQSFFQCLERNHISFSSSNKEPLV